MANKKFFQILKNLKKFKKRKKMIEQKDPALLLNSIRSQKENERKHQKRIEEIFSLPEKLYTHYFTDYSADYFTDYFTHYFIH